MCLLTIYISSLEKCLDSLPIFKLKLLVILLLSYLNFFVFWILINYLIIDFQIFSPFLKVPLHLVDCFICCVEAFWFDVLPLAYLFIFFGFCFCCPVQNLLPRWCQGASSLCFNRFMVSCFIFKSLFQFEFIFVSGVR